MTEHGPDPDFQYETRCPIPPGPDFPGLRSNFGYPIHLEDGTEVGRANPALIYHQGRCLCGWTTNWHFERIRALSELFLHYAESKPADAPAHMLVHVVRFPETTVSWCAIPTSVEGAACTSRAAVAVYDPAHPDDHIHACFFHTGWAVSVVNREQRTRPTADPETSQ